MIEEKNITTTEEIDTADKIVSEAAGMADGVENKDPASYDESQIQVLEGLEPVRKRPGMYIGTTTQRGLHHLVYEIVDNSIDEAMAGICTQVDVVFLPDGSVSVQDNGRGVPGGINAQTGIPTLEVVFTVLHAGGKFGGGGYKFSGGLHGVGASVVNALSEWTEVLNKHEGKVYSERFERGHVARPFAQVGECDPSDHGLYVRFKPDAQIFTETTVFDYDTILTRMREQAFLNAGIRITVRDERDNARDEEGNPRFDDLLYEGGVKSFVEFLNSQKACQTLHDVIYMSAAATNEELGDRKAEIAIQFNDTYSETMISFANNIVTPEGGTHEDGFKQALTRVVNAYAKKKSLLKENDPALSGEDIREGICAVISVKLQEPQFEGQTKGKLGNGDIRGFVSSLVGEKLAEFFEENPGVARTIVDKALRASQAREAARKARESVRRKTGLESGQMPEKLQDCNERDPSLCELFVVEGDSAGGSAIQGRDSRYQAILSMWGKMLNVEKARADKIYGNDKLYPMIVALGTGIGSEFNIEKLRYHKIIIMADADVDGAHIRTLLLTFFFRYMRPLIEHGYVYSAVPPLYKLTRGKTVRVAYSDEERDAVSAEMRGGNPNVKIDISRFKGLGEMDPKELKATTMDPEKRTLRRITLEDAIQADSVFTVLMGEEVEPRKDWIERNAKYVVNLDV